MLKSLLERLKGRTSKVLGVVGLAAFSFVVTNPVFAAVDADVASTTSSIVATMKENIIGVITTNISDIVIVGVILFSIRFVYRLARSFMR